MRRLHARGDALKRGRCNQAQGLASSRLCRARLAQYPIPQPRDVAFTASRKFEDPDGDGFPLAPGFFGQLERSAYLVECLRHRPRDMRLEHGLTLQVREGGSHGQLLGVWILARHGSTSASTSGVYSS
jgi:hypothetical protein